MLRNIWPPKMNLLGKKINPTNISILYFNTIFKQKILLVSSISSPLDYSEVNPGYCIYFICQYFRIYLQKDFLLTQS